MCMCCFTIIIIVVVVVVVIVMSQTIHMCLVMSITVMCWLNIVPLFCVFVCLFN